MRLLRAMAQEVLNLFVDDGLLAVAIIGVIALAAIVAAAVPGTTAGVVLVAGSLFALFANVLKN